MILKHRDMELLRFDWLEPQGVRVSSGELADLLGVIVRTVQHILARLREEGRITRVGSDKTGHWVVK